MPARAERGLAESASRTPPGVSARHKASKTEKFSKHFLRGRATKIFQLRKRKFFCFAILLTPVCRQAGAELRRRFPPFSPPSAEFVLSVFEGAKRNIISFLQSSFYQFFLVFNKYILVHIFPIEFFKNINCKIKSKSSRIGD